MIDERIRIQENYDMTLETAIDEAREEGLEQGRKQLVCEMISRGMTPDLISEMTGLSLEEIETLLFLSRLKRGTASFSFLKKLENFSHFFNPPFLELW